LSLESFIDLCILLGCDYCDTIRGIGPKRAFELITKYKSIEEVIKHLDPAKYPLPGDWPYAEVRDLFLHPEVLDPTSIELKWTDPDEKGLLEFLVNEMQFSEKRVLDAIEKLKKSKSTTVQSRLESFFGAPKRKSAESESPVKKPKLIPQGKGKNDKKGKGKSPK